LDPQVAQSMALRLAGDLASRTGHPAPQGVHPAAYLGAVLAERQRREWARATGAHQQAIHQQAAQQPAQPQGFQQQAVPQQTPYPQPGGPPVRVHEAWAAQRPAPAPAPPAPPAPLPQQAAQPAPAQPATPQPQPQPGTGFAPPG
jgi:hypothetical protein